MEGAPLFVENGSERKADQVESRKSKSKKAEAVGLFAVEHADHISSGKNIETLNRPELLNLSEKIMVDGSSLRQIYESKLVAEHGLRRLVAEHLRGGDLRKALRQEIVEREIDFERDPSLRDLRLADPKTNSGSAELNKMLDKASAALGGKEEEVAFFKARADYEAKQGDYQQQQSRLVNIALIATIAILVILIMILLLSKG